MAPAFAKLLTSQLVRTATGFHKLAVQLVKARLRRGWPAFAKLLISQLVRTVTGFHKSAVQLVKARLRRGWPAFAKLLTSRLVRTATGFHKLAVQLVKARLRRGWPAVAKLVTLLHVSCKYPFLSHFVYPAGKPMIPHHLVIIGSKYMNINLPVKRSMPISVI